MSSKKRRAITAQVLLRDGYRCRLRLPGCTVVGTEPDHVVPDSLGGSHDLANLRASCRHCNATRQDAPLPGDPALPDRGAPRPLSGLPPGQLWPASSTPTAASWPALPPPLLLPVPPPPPDAVALQRFPAAAGRPVLWWPPVEVQMSGSPLSPHVPGEK